MKLDFEYINLLNSLGTGVACIDAKTHEVLFINPSLEELSLFNANKLENLKFQDLFVPIDQNRVTDMFFLNSLSENSFIHDKEFILKRKSGRLCNVSLSAKNLENKGIILVTIIDNTPRKELEKELQEVYSQMIQTSKFISLAEMAAGIAHEINNPLAIIYGVADQLDLYSKVNKLTDEKLKKSTKTLKETTMRATKIIENLKSLSRNDSCDPMQTELFSNILNSALELCSKKINHQGITLTIDNDLTDAMILCHPSQILQTLLNLIENSIYAVKNTENSWIKIKIFNKDEKITIQFSDSGPGINEQNKNKIMNPFFTTKPVGEGTGLGLSISKNIISKHNGDFYLLENCEHTTFEMALPLVKDELKGTSNSSELNLNLDYVDIIFEDPSFNMKNITPSEHTILIIDDEPDIIELAEFQLEHIGFKTLHAKDGLDAIKIIEKNHIDIIVSDIRMPNMDGEELLNYIYQSPYNHIKVIFITGSVNYSREHFYSLGAQAIFNKPIDYSHILNEIHHCISQKDNSWERSCQRIQCVKDLKLNYSTKKLRNESTLVNIGRGGMFISMNSELPSINDYLSFKLKVENDSEVKTIDGICVVRWIRAENSDLAPRGIGVEFQTLNDTNNTLHEILNYNKSKLYIPKDLKQVG